MHIIPAMLIGVAAWIAVLCLAPSIQAVGFGPFIVSGVAMVLALLPGIPNHEYHGAAVTYTLAASLLIVVGSIMLI